jgi:SAM-dependent methyltransferase
MTTPVDLQRAALRGEPSYVWRAGQSRRLRMILDHAEGRDRGDVLDDGCGVGIYLERLARNAKFAVGVEYEIPRARKAREIGLRVTGAAAERLPFPANSFDLVLSHEVLEHVADDRAALEEIVRTLRVPDPSADKPGGRLFLFAPNRGYPFETHGVYWRGRYRFGNIPFVNYLPRRLRDRLAPHVRVYSRRDVKRLAHGLPLKIIHTSVIFGAYDNIIARWPRFGRALRAMLHFLERTPFKVFGLSHFWVLERT